MTDSTVENQKKLDSTQYQLSSIRHYEQIFGEDFVSPGGLEMAREMIARLRLEPGARVLDVGCGLGGSAFVMAREFEYRVDAIDLSKNMLEVARNKAAEYGLQGQVELRWGDCLELQSRDQYDAIYSRDVFLHINQKPRLFAVLHDALHSSGKLLFTDYCCGPKPWSDDFESYVDSRGYDLHTVDAYAGLIAEAGFEQVCGEDITSRFIDILKSDLERIFTLEIDAAERDVLALAWQQKLIRAQQGHHAWGLFSARKI